MALNKNKTEKYLNVYNLKFEIDIDSYYELDYYWDYYWDYYDEYCTESCCYPEYIIKERLYKSYIHKRCGRVVKQTMLLGELIDMDSIYEMGTIYYRERMLSRLLGYDNLHKEIKTTIGDYFPKINK